MLNNRGELLRIEETKTEGKGGGRVHIGYL